MKRAGDYVAFFHQRSDHDGDWYREDKRWKLVFPNPNYEQELDASNAWYQGCYARLLNLTYALNLFVDAVRTEVVPDYRSIRGVFHVHDSLGVTNKMVGVSIEPTGFTPI